MDEELIWNLTWDVCMAWMHRNPGKSIDDNVIRSIHIEIIKDYDNLSVKYKELLKGNNNRDEYKIRQEALAAAEQEEIENEQHTN